MQGRAQSSIDGRECSWSARRALGVGWRTKTGTEEEEDKRGTKRAKWKRVGDHGCHTVSYSICCSAEQSGAARGGQASLHRGGERLRERRGGGNQLNISPPPGREAQRDRPRRRLTHTQSKTQWRVARSPCRGRKEPLWDRVPGEPLLNSKSTRAQAGPAKKKKEFDRERGVQSPNPASFDSPATFPSPWGSGPSWRGCWRQLSSSTLQWSEGKALIEFMCRGCPLLYLWFCTDKLCVCMHRICNFTPLQKIPSQACPSALQSHTVILAYPVLHPRLVKR